MSDSSNIPERVAARKRAFLAAFERAGVVGYAAKIANIHRDQPRRWCKEDPEFRAAFKAAHAQANDLLEYEAVRRATKGTERPVWQGGEMMGVVREYSDTLLIFLLKGRKPKKFRDRHEISGPKGGPIRITTNEREILDKLNADPEASSAMDLISSRLARNAPIQPGDN